MSLHVLGVTVVSVASQTRGGAETSLHCGLSLLAALTSLGAQCVRLRRGDAWGSPEARACDGLMTGKCWYYAAVCPTVHCCDRCAAVRHRALHPEPIRRGHVYAQCLESKFRGVRSSRGYESVGVKELYAVSWIHVYFRYRRCKLKLAQTRQEGDTIRHHDHDHGGKPKDKAKDNPPRHGEAIMFVVRGLAFLCMGNTVSCTPKRLD